MQRYCRLDDKKILKFAQSASVFPGGNGIPGTVK